MEDLSLHILDIVENSIRAGAKKIEIKITEEIKRDLLTLEIIDDGKGMDKKTLKNVLDPFFTTKNKGNVGLGLPLLFQSAEESGGGINIKSEPGRGTLVRATFGYSHIDRKPLGNIAESIKVLIAANPEINFIYEYKKDDVSYRLDTKEIKK
ncbi:MAG: ATP-binding protein [Actinobacteria bacterium]|nr:ATP-binding protein [Actinomycetota bacterium]